MYTAQLGGNLKLSSKAHFEGQLIPKQQGATSMVQFTSPGSQLKANPIQNRGVSKLENW